MPAATNPPSKMIRTLALLAAFSLAATSSALDSLNTGLKGAWICGPGSCGPKTLVDWSGEGNHGITQTATVSPAGDMVSYVDTSSQVSTIAHFDHRADTDPFDVSGTEFTIALDVRRTGTDDSIIMAYGPVGERNHRLFYDVSESLFKPAMTNAAGTYTQINDGFDLPSGTWVNILYGYDGTDFYCTDGTTTGSATLVGGAAVNDTAGSYFELGRDYDGSYDGTYDIKNLRVWHRTLTSEEQTAALAGWTPTDPFTQKVRAVFVFDQSNDQGKEDAPTADDIVVNKINRILDPQRSVGALRILTKPIDGGSEPVGEESACHIHIMNNLSREYMGVAVNKDGGSLHADFGDGDAEWLIAETAIDDFGDCMNEERRQVTSAVVIMGFSESSSADGAPADFAESVDDDYEAMVARTKAQLEARLGYSVPFGSVIVQLSDNQVVAGYAAHREIVAARQEAFAGRRPNVRKLVNTDGFSVRSGDEAHFDWEGIVDRGEACAAAALQVFNVLESGNGSDITFD